MISATIQGKDKSNNRQHTTAKNGELITGEAQKKCVNAILKDSQNVNIDGEYYCELENSKFFCALYHPECDDIGRMRIALIVWDKDTSDELIQKTLEVMGFEYNHFLELKSEFEARVESNQQVGANKNKLVAIMGGIALVAFVAYLLTKK